MVEQTLITKDRTITTVSTGNLYAHIEDMESKNYLLADCSGPGFKPIQTESGFAWFWGYCCRWIA